MKRGGDEEEQSNLGNSLVHLLVHAELVELEIRTGFTVEDDANRLTEDDETEGRFGKDVHGANVDGEHCDI